MIITRATESTIKAVIYLADRYPAETVPKAEICDSEGITPAFLTKILQPLIQAGIINSTRGPAGGFALAVNPEKLTLLDILNVVEEAIELNVCTRDEPGCQRSSGCIVSNLWSEAKGKVEEVFSRNTIAELLKTRCS